MSKSCLQVKVVASPSNYGIPVVVSIYRSRGRPVAAARAGASTSVVVDLLLALLLTTLTGSEDEPASGGAGGRGGAGPHLGLP